MYLRIRPVKLFVSECFAVASIVGLLSYRYFGSTSDLVDPVSPLPLSPVPMGRYPNGAVASVGEPCARIGTDVLRDGGNAVDAAIATMLCDSVACPDLTGVGGGFLMTVYNRTTGTSLFVNARVAVPAAANLTAFADRPTRPPTGDVLAIAVPGMLRGVWVAYNSYGGGVSWASLVRPTIRLCERGVVVSKRLADNINVAKRLVLNSGLKEYFFNNRTGELMRQGDVYTMPKLGRTLRIIADEGMNPVYERSLISQLASDVQSAGGIVTAKDLEDYTVRVETSFQVKLKNGYKLYSGLPPDSGMMSAYILRMLDGEPRVPDAGPDAVRLVEASERARDQLSRPGDRAFANASHQMAGKVTADAYAWWSDAEGGHDDEYDVGRSAGRRGTDNVAVMDSNGNAVTVASSVNTAFGSGFVSLSTGIIFNDEMNDLSTAGVPDGAAHPSPANATPRHKRPTFSSCQTVMTDDNDDVVLVIGGTAGSKVAVAAAHVSALVLWRNKTLKEAVEAPRFYRRSVPTRVDYEYGVLKSVVDALRHVGHHVRRMTTTGEYRPAVTAIHRTPEGSITVMTDFRQQGNVSGY